MFKSKSAHFFIDNVEAEEIGSWAVYSTLANRETGPERRREKAGDTAWQQRTSSSFRVLVSHETPSVYLPVSSARSSCRILGRIMDTFAEIARGHIKLKQGRRFRAQSSSKI